ncbi:hypothetical protein N7454_006579 [Penicillium verhagenii]|nr:hypothetical protein N7454_006579 [Penicillium verhagenii]
MNRLSLANATSTPLPPSPSFLLPDTSSSSFPLNHPAPRPSRTPSSNSLRDERRKSIPVLQKRSSTASLRSTSGNHRPSSPKPDTSRRSSANFAGSPSSGASPAMAMSQGLTVTPPKSPVTTQRLTLTPPKPPVASQRVTITPPKPPIVATQRFTLNPPKLPTAASIAAEHFEKEIDLHQAVDLRSQAVVVIHDACYGHRFARPRTTKTRLNEIVERPERLRACVAGVSAAYVRLARRHAGEYTAPHPLLDINILPPPPFQIRKSSRSLSLTNEAVTSVHGALTGELKEMCDLSESRLVMGTSELVRKRTHDDMGNDTTGPELHTGDLYLCAESQQAFEGALGAVCDGIDTVLGPGPTNRAFVCIRPPGHHCAADFPSGFCWVNNVHVGISYAANKHNLTHAAILDFDLHHGDGSQDIAWEHNQNVWEASGKSSAYDKTPIGYYSLHDINSYPCENGKPDKVRNASVCLDAQGQSIHNIHLATWETEAEFWDLYETKYKILIDKARDFLRKQTKILAKAPKGPRPKAAIFISAGFDASEWESTGMQRHKVNVPTEFYAKFTADVLQMSQEEDLGVDGRVISVLEGGYSNRALASGVLSHLSALGATLPNITSPRQGDIPASTSASPSATYRVDWWSPENLSEMEALMFPPIKSREKAAPTFSNPTRSFSAKARGRKSFGSNEGIDPTMPLPEVGWATAAHELWKTLVPQDRQTMSCRPEDLNAAATRERYASQVARGLSSAENYVIPVIPVPPPPPPPPPTEDKRQPRAKKSKAPTAPVSSSSRPGTPRQQAMRNKNRRKTLDGRRSPDASGTSSPSEDANRRKSATAIAPATPPVEIGDLVGSESHFGTYSAIAHGNSTASGTRPGRQQQPQIKIEKTAAAQSSTTAPAGRLPKTLTSRPATPKRQATPRKAPPVPKVPTTFLPSKLSDQVKISGDEAVEELTAGLDKIKLVLPEKKDADNGA